MERAQADRKVCPVCGQGRLVDVAFDAGTGEKIPEGPKQLSDSSEIDVYDCGHEATGSRLDRADRSLGVETRNSREPVGDPDVEEPRPRRLGGTA